MRGLRAPTLIVAATGSTRASIKLIGSATTAIWGGCNECSGVTARSLIVDGSRKSLGAVSGAGALLEPLRAWVRDGRPTWGTCAGMILLAREAAGGKRGGQHLLGGIDVRVGRNGFGTQVSQLRAVQRCGVGER